MIVRDGNQEDFDKCVEYGYKFFQLSSYNSIPYDGESVKRMLNVVTDQGLFVVAEENGVVVGMAGGITSPAYFNNDYLVGAELFWWVEPEYRDTGVGVKLLVELENRARAADITLWSMMLLETLEPEKSTEIYKKLGYKPAERTFLKGLKWQL